MGKDTAKEPLDFNRLWNYEDLSRYTGIAVSTLKQRVSAGDIPSIKIGKHRKFEPKKIQQHFYKLSS